MLNHQAPKHNCFDKKRSKINSKDNQVYVNMELRAKSEPKEFDEKSNSAHQFSVRDKSLQCDSEERQENAMQTSQIDK